MLGAAAVVGAAWLAYDRVYARGAEQTLEWRDRTAALGTPAFRREAAGAFASRAELSAFLDREVRGSVPRLPPLDLSREVAVLATVGPRSSTGYRVEIVSVREQRGRVVVRLRERAPRLGDAVEPRVTYPFRLVTVDDTGKPVVLEWEGR